MPAGGLATWGHHGTALAARARLMSKLTDFVTEWQLPDQRQPRREPAATVRPDQLDRHPAELRVHHRDGGGTPRSAPST